MDVSASLTRNCRWQRRVGGGGKLRYLVKWEGFGVEHNSWEPWDNVHATDLMADFYQRHPGAARHICMVNFRSIPFRSVSGRHCLEGGWMLGDAPLCPTFPLIFLVTSVYSPSLLLAQDGVHSWLQYRSPMVT